MSSSLQTNIEPPPKLDAASVNRSIFRAAVSVGAVGVVVKFAGMLKEIAVAGVYGRSDAMDAFLAAALIPSLLVNLISESMNQALVPTLVRVREQRRPRSARSSFFQAPCSGCACFSRLQRASWRLARASFFPLIASHFAPAKLALSIHLFYALLPVVLITGIATNCTAVLNTLDRFALPALAPVIISIAIIFGALTLGHRLGIWAMVYATLAGSLLHCTIVAGMMHARGYQFRLWWHGMNEATREVGRQYGPVLLSGVVASGGLLVDQSMAAMLPAGQRLALVYANRFVSVVLTLHGRRRLHCHRAVYFSRIIAHRDWKACRHTLRTWVGITA